MILDDILKILKKKSSDKSYTVNNISYTYSELYKYVCNIYHFILKENTNKQPIVVYGHKEIYMKATFIACSLAGFAYVPIDESTPDKRVTEIIKQVKPKLIIGKSISKNTINKIMNNDNFEEIDKILLTPKDIYYIMFTSGSTGIPKGVKVTYENIDSCVNWLKKITGFTKGVILNQANFSFDLSVADLYLTLITRK